MISTWQQSGRAGRSNQKSLAILVAFENQLDQYFMNNPDFFFDKPHENVIIDLSNHILQEAHLLCAAKELTLKKDEAMDYFGVDKEVLGNWFLKGIYIKIPVEIIFTHMMTIRQCHILLISYPMMNSE